MIYIKAMPTPTTPDDEEMVGGATMVEAGYLADEINGENGENKFVAKLKATGIPSCIRLKAFELCSCAAVQ